ncbi:uncharacterized protein [Macaca nemestrina]|uniref:uncharacterized protein isoform X2 n=1 Tax=Macaca nemestrina TaxID=9545 RepID=UPI0039B8670D
MVPVLQSNNFRGRGGKTSEEAAGREPSIMRQGRAMSTMQECSGMIPAHYILELLGSCDPPTSFSKFLQIWKVQDRGACIWCLLRAVFHVLTLWKCERVKKSLSWFAPALLQDRGSPEEHILPVCVAVL